MTAQEAKEAALKKNIEKFEKGSNSIKQKIEGAANMGKYAITVYDPVETDVLDHLKSLGYVIKHNEADFRDQRDTGSVTISWQ